MERDLKIDNVKGALIMLVVIGHFLLPLEAQETKLLNNLLYTIYAFHMPCFIFISGYLSKGLIKNGKFQWKKWITILWLYIFYKILVFFSEIPAYGKTSDFPDFFRESGAPWYLLALSIWYLGIIFFHRIKTKRMKWITFLSIMIFGLFGGYLDQVLPIHTFLALDRIIAFSPFFYGGYFIGEKEYLDFFYWKNPRERDIGPERTENGKSRRKHASPGLENKLGKQAIKQVIKFCLLILGMVSGTFLFLYTRDLLWSYRFTVYGAWYSRYWPWTMLPIFAKFQWLPRLIWYAMASGMGYALFLLMPAKRCFWTTLGERTLQIYILHRPVRDLLVAFGYFERFSPHIKWQVGILVLSAAVLSILLACPVFTVFMKWIQNLPASCMEYLKPKGKS